MGQSSSRIVCIMYSNSFHLTFSFFSDFLLNSLLSGFHSPLHVNHHWLPPIRYIYMHPFRYTVIFDRFSILHVYSSNGHAEHLLTWTGSPPLAPRTLMVFLSLMGCSSGCLASSLQLLNQCRKTKSSVISSSLSTLAP